jgi:two-component system response regulator PilR (NtrC family)
MKPRILVVDDEQSMRDFLQIFLTKEGHDVAMAPNGQKAIELLDAQPFDLVITDLKMPKVDGIAVLKKARAVDPETQVLVITAFASHETAVEAMKAGAYDYLVKPFKVDEVRHFVGNALERRRLSRENVALRQQLGERYGFDNLVGSDPRMLEVYDLIRRVADTPTNLLITGETGTGKELVARAVHANSPRAREPFVVINCGAIPGELLESELFGHKRGSFTGAVADKKGLLEIAAGGTVFLDEVAELPAPMQVKLLRALQQRTIMPIGATREQAIDVRLLSATNRRLAKEVAEGRFREDLYYRLNVVSLTVPPLRERREDLPDLVSYFLKRFNRELKKRGSGISPGAMKKILAYGWPGNVRQLENVLKRAMVLCQGEWILEDQLLLEKSGEKIGTEISHDRKNLEGLLDIFFEELSTPSVTPQELDMISFLEKGLILRALQRTRGNQVHAAQLLGMNRSTLRGKMDKYHIKKDVTVSEEE